MSNLSNSIYHYYLAHFEDLPFDKQFHFASRLYLWNQDKEAEKILADLRPTFTSNGNPRAAVEKIIEHAKASPVHGSKNAAALRRPYFERYPLLKTYVSVLFRLTFLESVYQVDARDLFEEIFTVSRLEAFRQQLLADREALAILSTHAINFLYLYDRIIKRDEASLDPHFFLEIGHSAYDRTSLIDLQLLVYLYTHCILGESKFYYRCLPASRLETYRDMMQELEEAIAEHFTEINLDNKCEFLACCQLTGVTSTLQPRIFEEASRSLSDQGTFLIDRHNQNPQTNNVSLDKSEHRNVLFILANRSFTPLG